jgi:DNA-binding XRE family transcriptional regulator
VVLDIGPVEVAALTGSIGMLPLVTLTCQPLVAYNFDCDGKDLREWRETNKLTQDQLADKLKVARNTVSRWEAGTRTIPPYLELALKQLASRPSKQRE